MRAGLLLALAGCADEPAVDSGGPAPPGDAAPHSVSARLHEGYGSLVYVAWEQPAAATAWVEFSVDEGAWLSTPPEAVDAGPQEALLLGVPYGHEVTFRVGSDGGGGVLLTDTDSVTTDPLPEGAHAPDAVEGDPAGWDADRPYVFLSMESTEGYGYWAMIVDRQGRVVWARENSLFTISLHPRVASDGAALLIDESTFWTLFDEGADSRVVRTRLDGSGEEVYATPGLHHPFTDTADGSIIWAAVDGQDERLMRLRPDGVEELVFDCGEFRRGLEVYSYCGSNTVWWNEADDTFLYSLYSLETVVEVDAATGEALRWFGHVPGAWSFSPTESAFWWQHGGYYTDAGTFLTSSKYIDGGQETVVREYELDAASEALVEVWSFGEGEGVYGDVMGEAHRLPGGNTLHNYGSAALLREVTPAGEVVWEVSWDAEFMGRSEPVGDLYALAP